MMRVNRYLNKISTLDPYADSKLAEYLESMNFKKFLFSKTFTPTVRSIITSNMRTIYALELDQINALFGLVYLKAGGGTVEAITYSDEGCAQEKRVKGGTQQISKRCVEEVLKMSDKDKNSADILFNTAMLHVKQQSESDLVEILTRNTQTGEKITFKTRKIISSIPINQYSAVDFTPELPTYKRNFFKFVQVGNYIKFVVTYKTHFWRKKGLSGEGTYDGSVMWLTKEKFEEFYKDEMKKPNFNKQMPKHGAVAEVFDATNEQGEPALVGFIASEVALEWADLDESLRRQEVLENLARLYGREARDYVDYIEKNWAHEPFNGGCPCYNVVSSGVMKDFARATREPFINVHFAVISLF
jgi:monoamine oxidase